MQCRCIAYNVIALLAEVNSIFLHARKLLQMSGFRFSGWLYRANAAANIASFVPCRFGGLAWIIYGMTRWNDRVSPIYLYLLGAAIFVLWVTNTILYWRLISSDLLRQSRPVAKSQVALSVQCNGTAAVNGSVSGHSVSDIMDPKLKVFNGQLAVETMLDGLRHRDTDAMNGTV